MLIKLFSFLLFTAVSTSQTFHDTPDDILVLVDNKLNRDAFSIFLESFKDLGFVTRIKTCDDPTLTILRHTDYSYKTILLLCPNVRTFGGNLDVQSLVKFMNDGGNLLITGDSYIGEAIRELGSEMGVEFDQANSAIIDNLNYEMDDNGLHTRILISEKNLVNSQPIIGKEDYKLPFLYEGVGISFPSKNTFLTDILHAEKTSYCYNPNNIISDYPNCVGKNAKLIVGLQARNNARVIMMGSVKFLTNDFMTVPVQYGDNKVYKEGTSNRQLAASLCRWLSHKSGVLRVKSVTHHKINEKTPPREYTINEDIIYAIDIEELNENGKWGPYLADDVQMEFVRIDPFVRKTMEHSGNHYFLKFKIPDTFGVFKFSVDYQRTGYTYLNSITEVSVRPLLHTQYERFISAAYPYYVNAFSMMASLILFSFIFLYIKEDPKKKKD